MGQDRGLWLPTQRFSSLSSQPLSHLGKQDLILVSKPCGYTTDMVSARGSNQVSTQFSHSYFDGFYGWVNGSSHLRHHQFLPPQNHCLKKIPLIADSVIYKAEEGQCGQCSQKRFLVFDQFGHQTTMLLNTDTPKCLEALKLPTDSDMKKERQISNKDLFVSQGIQGNIEPNTQEDTEELNALLYSEDESDHCSEEDEITSSGHSPSTIVSAHVEKDTFVKSFGKPLHSKKRKILETSMPFLETSNKNMLDVESSCGSCDSTGNDSLKRLKPSSNKISKEEILEIVSLLRSTVLPGEEPMDPILVFDRAIDYLNSLKMETEHQGHGTLCLQDM